MKARKFYGFQFKSGEFTTTGGPDKFWIAGNLYAFDSKRERDQWVAAGYQYKSDKFRKAVKRADLPSGWRVEDAQETRKRSFKWISI